MITKEEITCYVVDGEKCYEKASKLLNRDITFPDDCFRQLHRCDSTGVLPLEDVLDELSDMDNELYPQPIIDYLVAMKELPEGIYLVQL